MNKNLLMIVAGILFFTWGRWFSSDDLRPELYGMSIGIFATLIIDLIYKLYSERNFLRLYLNSQILKRNSELRLSIAYLFKIEMKGKYLMVKNSRFPKETYQPVGGVYKYFHPEASKELGCMTIITDNAIENDKKSEYDLRVKMSKRKNLRKFIKWFFDSPNREKDPWREFYEELVETQILPSNHFNFIFYDLVGQHFEDIHRDLKYKIDTFKYVDVYTPRYVNQKQIDEIEKLLEANSDEFIWVTEEEISAKFSKDGKRISDHAHKIFFTKKLN